MWITMDGCMDHNASSFGMEFGADAQRIHVQIKWLNENKEREKVPELLLCLNPTMNAKYGPGKTASL